MTRHAGATQAEVTLTRCNEGIQLRVADAGRGFDLKQAGQRGGLGLISVQERVRLLRGSLQVTTLPGCGTELLVRIPLAERTQLDARERGYSSEQ